MTIMAGSVAAGQQCTAGAVTDNSRLETPQGKEKDWEWPKSFEILKPAPPPNSSQLVPPAGDKYSNMSLWCLISFKPLHRYIWIAETYVKTGFWPAVDVSYILSVRFTTRLCFQSTNKLFLILESLAHYVLIWTPLVVSFALLFLPVTSGYQIWCLVWYLVHLLDESTEE